MYNPNLPGPSQPQHNLREAVPRETLQPIRTGRGSAARPSASHNSIIEPRKSKKTDTRAVSSSAATPRRHTSRSNTFFDNPGERTYDLPSHPKRSDSDRYDIPSRPKRSGYDEESYYRSRAGEDEERGRGRPRRRPEEEEEERARARDANEARRRERKRAEEEAEAEARRRAEEERAWRRAEAEERARRAEAKERARRRAEAEAEERARKRAEAEERARRRVEEEERRKYYAQQPLMDPWKVLELKRDATDAEIKKAYHKLAMKRHPDTPLNRDNQGAKEKFQELVEAYGYIQTAEDREKFKKKEIEKRMAADGAAARNQRGAQYAPPPPRYNRHAPSWYRPG
ncbi:DnaJ-domain-containing protein [Sporormia fimetaria CBS 119925]|uniref:DnaJ-domain-containing protein n=1 Tax=Sporormia fimetaria CBS 119925 TaxID=1340428 RepID=A0A6A6UWG8_9PLEO|nr:DnaJ-domain-containing protein [Sporormia fimetaria CBS 119925]